VANLSKGNEERGQAGQGRKINYIGTQKKKTKSSSKKEWVKNTIEGVRKGFRARTGKMFPTIPLQRRKVHVRVTLSRKARDKSLSSVS